jgi:predicted MFS family arabinose efflux permease
MASVERGDGSGAVALIAVPPPPDAKRVIAILSICGLASTFAVRFIDPMIGVISRDLNADPHTIALLSTAFALPYAFIQPLLGPVGDALGKQRIIQICLAILALALAGALVTRDVPTLFVLRVLAGAAAGGIIPLSLATIGDSVPMAERQVAISRFLIFTISGQLVGGSLSGLLSTWIGWRGVFGLACGLALVAFAAVIVGLGRPAPFEGKFRVSVAAARYRRILAVPRARALYLFVFVEGAMIFGIQPYIAPMLEARAAGGAPQAGAIIAAFASGGILYTLTVGLLLRSLGLSRMLAVAGVICGAAFVTMGLGGAWTLDAGAMLAMGLGFYMLHNSFQTQVTEVVPDARASAVSLHAFSYFVGQAIGPVLFGLGLAGIGVAGATLVSALGMLALGLVAARVLGRPQSA